MQPALSTPQLHLHHLTVQLWELPTPPHTSLQDRARRVVPCGGREGEPKWGSPLKSSLPSPEETCASLRQLQLVPVQEDNLSPGQLVLLHKPPRATFWDFLLWAACVHKHYEDEQIAIREIPTDNTKRGLKIWSPTQVSSCKVTEADPAQAK